MKNKRLLEDVGEYFLTLLFPNRCKFCDKVTEPFEDICEACNNSVPWIDGEICKNCGTLKSDCTCSGRHGQYYEGIVAPLYFEASVRACIHRYKFYDERLCHKYLADLMSDTCKERYKDISFDYVAYIPMRKKSQRKRGYNQSRLLAKRIAENLNVTFGDNLLIKLYDTKIQHDCNEIERSGNLVGVFDVNKSYDVSEKTILLIDDVKTSGATLSECGKMLYLNGASHVYCLTAALVRSKINKKD